VPPSQELPLPHGFLRPVRLAAVAGPSTPLLDEVLVGLAAACERFGGTWTTAPDDRTDAFVTTARLHEPIEWRQAPMFTGRKRFGLQAKPANYALVQVTREQLGGLLDRFAAALDRPTPDPAEFAFPGLSANAWQVLQDQGGRGGPMMCVARLLQAQAKSLRVLMVVGEQRVHAAHLFDLAGAFPRITADTPERFHHEVVLRMATQLSTREVTDHLVRTPPVDRSTWAASAAPATMLRVSRELGARRFFTRMVRIADLVDVPAITGTIAQQYSEGCFGTWDPVLQGQLVTVTGSLHPVVKEGLQEDDLALLVGVRPDTCGAEVQHVEGLRNAPPSSEAVEFESIDAALPRRVPPPAFGIAQAVPVVRSKLHGHRGVVAYDPATVEFVAMGAPFHHYLVSCSTEAQAEGVAAAFARSRALQDPDDPRRVVFTVLPGHGLLMVEKWVPGSAPFAELLAAMDERRLEISHGVPQGPLAFAPAGGRMVLRLPGGAVRLGDGAREALVRDCGSAT
jgi:hypothetical protein